jgi:hypothetical protein
MFHIKNCASSAHLWWNATFFYWCTVPFWKKLGIMFGSYLPKIHVVIGLVLSLFYMFALNNLSI